MKPIPNLSLFYHALPLALSFQAPNPIHLANHHASYAAPRPPPRPHYASIDGSNPSHHFLRWYVNLFPPSLLPFPPSFPRLNPQTQPRRRQCSIDISLLEPVSQEVAPQASPACSQTPVNDGSSITAAGDCSFMLGDGNYAHW